jgi:hypothetical protein
VSDTLARLLADATRRNEAKERSCSVCSAAAVVFSVGCGLGLGLRLCAAHNASLLPTVEGA